MTDVDGARLFPRHAAMLKASKIPPEHAMSRGYISVDSGNRKRLEEIGVTKSGRNVPGLLVPLLRRDGSTRGSTGQTSHDSTMPGDRSNTKARPNRTTASTFHPASPQS